MKVTSKNSLPSEWQEFCVLTGIRKSSSVNHLQLEFFEAGNSKYLRGVVAAVLLLRHYLTRQNDYCVPLIIWTGVIIQVELSDVAKA